MDEREGESERERTKVVECAASAKRRTFKRCVVFLEENNNFRFTWKILSFSAGADGGADGGVCESAFFRFLIAFIAAAAASAAGV